MRWIAFSLGTILCLSLAGVACAEDLVLEGKVVDSSGKPVEGARVMAWAEVADPGSSHTVENRSERLSEEECVDALTVAPPALRRRLYSALATGWRFEIAGETSANATGEFHATIDAKLARSSSFHVLAEVERGGELEQGYGWIYRSSVEPNARRTEDVVLVPCTRIPFRVTSNGKPVEGATLTLRQPFSLGFRCGNCEAGFWKPSKEWSLERVGGPRDDVETDIHGTYRVRTDAQGGATFVAAGRSSNSFAFGEAETVYTVTVSRPGLGTVHRVVHLGAIRSRDAVEEIALEPAASIMGVVLDASGAPAANADVTAFATDPASKALHRTGRTTTDAQGVFALDSLARDRYQLHIHAQSDSLEDTSLAVEAPAPHLRIALATAGTLAVSVAVPKDEESLQAMRSYAAAFGGVDIELTLEQQIGTSWVEVADASFGFRPGSTIEVPAMFGKLSPGTYRAQAYGSPLAITTSKPVTVERGKPATLSLELDPGRRLVGRVVDRDGKAIADSVTRSLIVEGRDVYSTMGGDDGTFDLHAVPHVPVRIEVEVHGYKKVACDVDAATTELGDVVLDPEEEK